MFKLSLVRKLAFVYLVLPVILFLFGWLNIIAASFVALVTLLSLFFLFKSGDHPDEISFTRRDIFWGLIILVAWLFFSGIGGYSFQNWDHHSRNAVFRDLIEYSWPVVYKLDPKALLGFSSSHILFLSYYFGFWLPSALVGKLAGWSMANFFLFVWSFGGVVLSIILIAKRTKLSLTKTTLLLILFSGMDALGVLLLKNIPGYGYPLLWPPIQHLEWWAGSLQYASFTTELFWTFNQFIPTLLVMSLLVNSINSRDAIFLGGVCIFYAPIPALGVIPFIAMIILKDIIESHKEAGIRAHFTSVVQRFLTLENFSGLLLGIVSLLFFSTNLSAQSRGFGLRVPILFYLIFLLVEGMILWFLLLPEYKNDWMWYVSGASLVLAPLIKLGESWDFMMRFSLPALFILMIGSGRFLSFGKKQIVRLALLTALTLGALTPLYEIGRSVVRFERYYQLSYLSMIRLDDYFQHPPKTSQLFVPEFDHINTLVADDWISVSFPNSDGWTTKVGNLFDSRFKWIWKQPLITEDDTTLR